MAFTPWMTSDDLIEAVKRKISFPAYQSTFDEEDILKFCNEEMFLSQVPSVLTYNEEYFVTSVAVTLVPNRAAYPIPDRAIGLRLRDVMYADGQVQANQPYGNLFEMTRVHADDKAFFQSNYGNSNIAYKFYLEGNNVVLSPAPTNPTGLLVFYFYIRPNQLVQNSRAAIISNFSKTITITNTSIVAGDTVTIGDQNFIAVAGSPSANEFQIAGTSSATATNLVIAINANGVASASNGTPATNIITVSYTDRSLEFSSSNSAAMLVQSTIGLVTSVVPSNITAGSYIDLLQTKPGHRIYKYDILVGLNNISGTTISLNENDVPDDFIVGDYVSSANECIIPFLPPDLHNGLADRAAARILSAIGDREGLQDLKDKLEQTNTAQGTLLDNRVEGAPQKVFNKHSLLRYGKFGNRRII